MFFFGYTLIQKTFCYIAKIDHFRGDLNKISAKTTGEDATGEDAYTSTARWDAGEASRRLTTAAAVAHLASTPSNAKAVFGRGSVTGAVTTLEGGISAGLAAQQSAISYPPSRSSQTVIHF